MKLNLFRYHCVELSVISFPPPSLLLAHLKLIYCHISWISDWFEAVRLSRSSWDSSSRVDWLDRGGKNQRQRWWSEHIDFSLIVFNWEYHSASGSWMGWNRISSRCTSARGPEGFRSGGPPWPGRPWTSGGRCGRPALRLFRRAPVWSRTRPDAVIWYNFDYL